MIRTSVKTDVSHITRRCCVLGPWTSRNCVSEYWKHCFANTQSESHTCITRNATFQKTTIVDFKITYTKTNTKKIHKLQGYKFLQIKHCSVYETEQPVFNNLKLL